MHATSIPALDWAKFTHPLLLVMYGSILRGFLWQQWGIDPNKIGVVGMSAGAEHAAGAATEHLLQGTYTSSKSFNSPLLLDPFYDIYVLTGADMKRSGTTRATCGG